MNRQQKRSSCKKYMTNRYAVMVAACWLWVGVAFGQKKAEPVTTNLVDTLVVGSDTVLIRETVIIKRDTVRLTQGIPQDTSYWQRSFNGNITLNQATFSNWIGGGVNSVSVGGIINTRALYQRARWSWDSNADLQLGFVRQTGFFQKASDQILLNSVAGFHIAPKLDLFASGTFTTYFAPGYEYKRLASGQPRVRIANFLSPAQLSTAFGLAYKPGDWLAIRFSPLATRFTFLADQSVRYRANADSLFVQDPTATVYGVAPGRSIRREWSAMQLQVALNAAVSRVFTFSAKYLLFANYGSLAGADHRIDLLVAANVTKYLGVTINVTALYDRDYSPFWQLQQTAGIGLTYTKSTFRKTKKDK